MEISVIIPTLNEEKYLKKCLESIVKQDFPRDQYEIIVSDGNSTDQTTKIAKKYADRVVVSGKKGIWWGRNFGAKFAKGKYLVFIDADSTIKPDYLKTIYPYLESGIVGLSAGLESPKKDVASKIIWTVMNQYLLLNSLVFKNSLLGFNLCVPKKTFKKVGGFKNLLLEDRQLDHELRKEGNVIFLTKTKVTTSDRRDEKLGILGKCRYFIELGLIDRGIIKNPEKSKLIKYKKYLPVR